MIQLAISLSYQLQIVIYLKHWIPNFLSFKTKCDLPQEAYYN